MKRFFLFFAVLVSGYQILIAQQDTCKVKWLKFEETKVLFEKNQKPVLIFFHDSKNDSSKLMLNNTFGLDEVANYVNILFYPIEIEIHTKEIITFFDGTVYSPSETPGGIHSIVLRMLGKDYQMPAMILFNNKAVGSVFQGFKDRDRIFPILIYYAESADNSISYNIFEKYYFKTYPPGQSQIMTRVLVKWMNLNEAFELNKTYPKKILINLYDNYSITSTMLNLKTFNDPIISEYLNKNFYCVNIDARTKDTIHFFSQKFINEGANHGFHQLTIAMLNGKMQFPAFLIFDENSKLIDRFQAYWTPDDFEALMHFIGENIYKKIKWEEYKGTFKNSFSN